MRDVRMVVLAARLRLHSIVMDEDGWLLDVNEVKTHRYPLGNGNR